MKQLFFYVSIALFLTGCKKSDAKPQLSADAEVTQKVNELYSTYRNSSDLYNKAIPENLFSPEMKTVLADATNASKADIEKIKKSDHPDDKPMLLEGSIFTSLYEGYTSYKIKSIDIMESTDPIGTAADVSIEFENSNVTPKVEWVDKIHLIEPFDTEFRIENIYFGKLGNNQNLKSNLQNFIKEAKK